MSVILNKFEKDMIGVDEKFIFNLFKVANFIIFFDGFDEVPVDRKGNVIQEINDFTHTYPKNTYVITSRNEAELSNFGQFHTYRIKPLENKEAYELIKKYSNNEELSNNLIKTIENTGKPAVEEFIDNPLLVSLLYFCYRDMNFIPNKRYLFYQKVYEALFRNHDITKERLDRELRTKLKEDDFQKVLGFIAYYSIPQGYVELSRIKFYNCLDEFKKRYTHLHFGNDDFIYDCTTSVPIFIEEENLRWVHKSMRDFFASIFWNREKKSNGEDLLKWSQKYNPYVNKVLLEICREIDERTYSRVVELPFLENILSLIELISSFAHSKHCIYFYYGKIVELRIDLRVLRCVKESDNVDTSVGLKLDENLWLRRRRVDEESEQVDKIKADYVGDKHHDFDIVADFIVNKKHVTTIELHVSELRGSRYSYFFNVRSLTHLLAKFEGDMQNGMREVYSLKEFDANAFIEFLDSIGTGTFSLVEILRTNVTSSHIKQLRFLMFFLTSHFSVVVPIFDYEKTKEYIKDIKESYLVDSEEFSL